MLINMIKYFLIDLRLAWRRRYFHFKLLMGIRFAAFLSHRRRLTLLHFPLIEIEFVLSLTGAWLAISFVLSKSCEDQ